MHMSAGSTELSFGSSVVRDRSDLYLGPETAFASWSFEEFLTDPAFEARLRFGFKF